MNSGALFEGHWRSLEQAFADQLDRSSRRPLAVVTAGYPLLERLLRLLESSGRGDLAGVQFFPGIPGLAQKLSPLPSPRTPSPADLAACTLAALGDPERVSPGSAFLAGLLEQGIGPDEYRLVLESLPEEPGPAAWETLGNLEVFRRELDAVLPRRMDTLLREKPAPAFEGVFFYGFYDLNPGQRRFVRALSETTELHWFSPVHPSSPWRSVYSRTGDFLGKLFQGRRHRVDAGTPLSPLARLGDSLLLKKALSPPPGVQNILCGTGMGFDAALAGAVGDMLNTRPGFRVAVSARGDDRRRVLLSLNLAGIPTSSAVSLAWNSTPFGRFLLGVCSLKLWDLHHLEIQRLLSSGVVFGRSAAGYLEVVSDKGARYGMSALESLDMDFTKKLIRFHEDLPEKAPPPEYLRSLLLLAADPPGAPLPSSLLQDVFDPLLWRSRRIVDMEGFRTMLDAQMTDTGRELFPGRAGGVDVLSPEQLRGTLFDGVVVTGLEEEVLPSRTVEDPRFPTILRRALEMSTGDTREKEEAFILRQAFEAAGEKMILVVRTRDGEGRSLMPSPFISALLENRQVPALRIPDHAPDLMPAPPEPPFLLQAVQAERERLVHRYFGPHDGVIGPTAFTPPDRINATMLENYQNCPFKFMAQRVWKLREPPDNSVRSFPDPDSHGRMVHRSVELALTGKSVESAVESVLGEKDLKAELGSDAFAANYREVLLNRVTAVMEYFSLNGIRPLAGELELEGAIAGIPANGRMDILAESPEGLIALDLKTGNPRKTVNPLNRTNLFQLPVYYSLCPRKPELLGYLHVHHSGGPVLNRVTAGQVEEALPGVKARIRTIFDRIRAGIFPPSGDEEVCRFCMFGGLCRISPRDRLTGKEVPDAPASS
jgi:hypothetical protein